MEMWSIIWDDMNDDSNDDESQRNSGPPAGGDRLVGVDRVLAVMTELAAYPEGIGLNELAAAMSMPRSTTHRALTALRRAGFASQTGRGQYVLGDGLLQLAFRYHEVRPDNVRIRSALSVLAQRFGETANYTVLDGRSVVYRSKVDSPTGAVKITSTVGERHPAHATAAGKVLLAHSLADREAVRAWVGDVPLERRTANTKVSVGDLHDELVLTRERGYGVDDEENEYGVNCVAIPVFLMYPSEPSGAVSMSGLAYRTRWTKFVEALPDVRRIIAENT